MSVINFGNETGWERPGGSPLVYAACRSAWIRSSRVPTWFQLANARLTSTQFPILKRTGKYTRAKGRRERALVGFPQPSWNKGVRMLVAALALVLAAVPSNAQSVV